MRMTVLKSNLARHPNDRDTLLALISFSRDSGDAKSALDYAQRLAQIVPADQGLTTLIDTLKRQVNSAPGCTAPLNLPLSDGAQAAAVKFAQPWHIGW